MRRFKQFVKEEGPPKKKEGPPTEVDKVKQQQDYQSAKADREKLIALQQAQQKDMGNKHKADLEKQGEKQRNKRLGISESIMDGVHSAVAGAKARMIKQGAVTLAQATKSLAQLAEKTADDLRTHLTNSTSDVGADDLDVWDKATEGEQLARKLDATADQLTKLSQAIGSGRYDYRTHHELAYALELLVDLKKTA